MFEVDKSAWAMLKKTDGREIFICRYRLRNVWSWKCFPAALSFVRMVCREEKSRGRRGEEKVYVYQRVGFSTPCASYGRLGKKTRFSGKIGRRPSRSIEIGRWH